MNTKVPVRDHVIRKEKETKEKKKNQFEILALQFCPKALCLYMLKTTSGTLQNLFTILFKIFTTKTYFWTC